ncbi:hypothetical protein LDO32_03660 [Luteimonas sp. Y-2-2-4F]|nr:hypothetical protein [Luteimonas sp. Y-2-2-4F]MCD9030830.1 hypothetical protein [Luteimonas sp. Y-2-2-4F]
MSSIRDKATGSVAVAVMAAVFGMLAPSAQAQESDPQCGSIVHYPGAVTVMGKAWGGAEGDFRSCSTNYRCARDARSVESFGYGYASHRDGVIATQNYAIAADGTEAVLASCEATPGRGKTRACQAEPQRFQAETAVAEEAECAVFVGAPAGGLTIATNTCFCEG